jgi:hypothetical protein
LVRPFSAEYNARIVLERGEQPLLIVLATPLAYRARQS